MTGILDPRSKIIILILGAIYIGLPLGLTGETVVILILATPFFIAKLYQWGIVFILIYSIQVLASLYLLPQIDGGFLIYIFSFLSNGLRMLMPSIMAGAYAVKTTVASELIAALKRLHVPNWLLIPIAVIVRFFPTVNQDYKHIRKAMAFRGIGTKFWDLAKHPMRTLEYILIPLLMNATQVSEDLTISALTKGLSLPGRHTSIVELKITAYDYSYLIIAALPFVLYMGGIPL